MSFIDGKTGENALMAMRIAIMGCNVICERTPLKSSNSLLCLAHCVVLLVESNIERSERKGSHTQQKQTIGANIFIFGFHYNFTLALTKTRLSNLVYQAEA